MKKKISLLLIICVSTLCYSQSTSLKTKLDSIVTEADLLYKYEKIAWNTTDLLMTKPKLKKLFGGYLIHHSEDTIYATFMDIKQKKRIAKYSFSATNLETPIHSDFDLKILSESENNLLDIKIKILNQLSDAKYEINVPKGFSPNLVLIKTPSEYKLYIIMGTSKSDIIPFGNDYLFRANDSGEITKWQKFHSRLIPVQTETPETGKITTTMHSHLKTTPLITATDICTFRLYAQYTDLESFTVYSPAIGKYMEYNIKDNLIKITD